jgi:tetratricopeptide (TPR) repeat protein
MCRGPAKRCRALRCPALGYIAGMMLFGASLVSGEPFLPPNGAQVLERLRSTAMDPDARELHNLRMRLTADPQNLELALQFARNCIERGRREADPRYLGRAQAALAPWWNNGNAPGDALVLRATIRQSQHDFTNALADLELVREKAPRSAQAWLTRATILTVLGNYPAARRACVPLAQLAPGLVALTAAASVACVNGEAERSCILLRNALETHSTASRSERLWALTVLGETSGRLGNVAEAEEFFKRALELEPRDAYLKGSYADLLLDGGRYPEAAALLKDESRADGLLLRLALAESKLESRPASLGQHIKTLQALFEAGHLRGDFVHQREEAWFALRLLGKPREALRLAQENWRVQHEPADARILLESALAAPDRAAAQPVLEFMRTSRLQDVRLTALASEIDKVTTQ